MLSDPEGRLYDDVDTDQIYHNRHLQITDTGEMGQHALGNLRGWEDFAVKARRSDIVVAGRNFGAGSSRQHAVDCFIALGVSAIVAESFGATFKRNAINSGFPVVEVPGLAGMDCRIESGQSLAVDLAAGLVTTEGDRVLRAIPFSRVQMDIYLAGDLFAYGKMLDQA